MINTYRFNKLLFVVLLFPIIAKSAVMFEVTGLDTNDTSVVDAVANTVTTSYSFTGDLDALADANDTITFDVVLTYGSGGTASISGVNFGDIDPTNTIDFAVTNVVLTRGGGATPNTVYSSEVVRVSHFGSTGDRTFTLGNAPTTTTVTQPRFQELDFAGTGVDPFLTLDSGPGTVTFRDIDVQFCVVPEPSSVLLLAVLGTLSLFGRRRRRF